MIYITITAPHHRWLADGGAITFDHAEVYEGVWMRHWDAQDNVLKHQDLSYAEYEQFRKDHPELNMPELRPRKPGTDADGNTIGKVVGETPSSGVPASEANPAVQAETSGEAEIGTKVLDGLQVGLDVAGLIPGFGEIADLANAGISAARGDFVGAGLSLAAAIPFAGWLATGAKGVKRGVDMAQAGSKATSKVGREAAEEGVEQAGKQGDEAVEAATTRSDSGGKVRDEKKKKNRNDDICNSLRRRIINAIIDLMEKRGPAIEGNTRLPFYDPYRKRPHAEDVLGHMLKFRIVQNELKVLIKAYKSKNCGPLPPGTEDAVSMDLPRPQNPLPPRPPDVTPKLPR